MIEKPTSFEGKDSESAWLFYSAFYVWVKSNKWFYQHWPNSICIVHQDREELLDESNIIMSALSFIIKDATVWAHSYLEQLMDYEPVFNNSKWDSFLKAFK
jgi:hypothetical protein